MTLEQRRQYIRDNYPDIIRFIDDMKAHFPDARARVRLV